jgi:hypothetical protein
VRGGFEPPVPLPVQRFSKAPLSTAQPPHLKFAVGRVYLRSRGRQTKRWNCGQVLIFQESTRSQSNSGLRVAGAGRCRGVAWNARETGAASNSPPEVAGIFRCSQFGLLNSQTATLISPIHNSKSAIRNCPGLAFRSEPVEDC